MRFRRTLYDEGSSENLLGVNKKSGGGGMKSNNSVNNNNNNNNTVSTNKKVETEDEEEMFGGRSYTASFCGTRNRPTMISAKYRQKEERRKVLKISINKLKKIEDPESSLRRSVLINNTMKRLQREAREEKMQKQQGVGGFRCFELLKEETIEPRSQELADITNLPGAGKKEEEGPAGAEDRGRKRSLEEEEDNEVRAVLSQFYMPLTPRMITSLDEDDEEILNVVDVEVEPKRARLEDPPPAKFSCGHSSIFNELQSVVYHSLIASLET